MEPITTFTDEHRFLSNFFPSRFEVRRFGKMWTVRTVEHPFQGMKTRDVHEWRRVLECSTPGRAKRMGRRVTMREEWDEIKVEVMRSLLVTKFSIPMLGDALVATGDRELIEGNSWGDTFWGVCDGVGENHLGRLLMEVRSQIKG